MLNHFSSVEPARKCTIDRKSKHWNLSGTNVFFSSDCWLPETLPHKINSGTATHFNEARSMPQFLPGWAHPLWVNLHFPRVTKVYQFKWLNALIFSTCYIKNENTCRRFILPQKICQKFVLSARRIYFLEQSCILPDLRTTCPGQQVTKVCNPLQHKRLCMNIFLHTRFFFEPWISCPPQILNNDFWGLCSMILWTKLQISSNKAYTRYIHVCKQNGVSACIFLK